VRNEESKLLIGKYMQMMPVERRVLMIIKEKRGEKEAEQFRKRYLFSKQD
jgi:hypothetical protein